MVHKKFSLSSLTEAVCCSCFGFLKKQHRSLRAIHAPVTRFSQEYLLTESMQAVDGIFYNGEAGILHGYDGEMQRKRKFAEELLILRVQTGMICREVPVKDTRHVTRSEDEDGNKMVNEYVREYKIGFGSYGKVVLYRSTADGKHYAIKAFHKSHLLKSRVAPFETAMTDALREVLIMKMLDHPNIVSLIEVIDDPNTDYFYMVMEYVEGKCVCNGSGPLGGIGEPTARRYLRDIVAGLMYLHSHNIVHGDIKPDNLLVTSSGVVKIGDFSVSQVYEDDDDKLRRSPGTPVFTAPECCLGINYHGRAADTWAVGVTMYCMVFGQYPFLGETIQDTYDKIVNNPVYIPEGLNPELKNLLEGLLCKDPKQRITLHNVATHSWVVKGDGPTTEYLCRCKCRSSEREDFLKVIKGSNCTNGADSAPINVV